jgi:hypothetical protein
MKRYFIKSIMATWLIASLASSCTKKLDLQPTNDVTAEVVYSTPAGYKQALAKVYGAFALTGNNGAGSGDIQGIDAGTSDFFRLFWKAQELTTDEAVVAWGDPGIQDLHLMNWGAANPLTQGLYYRCMYQITLANDFIRQSADDKVAGRGITGADADNIKKYRLEARFLRAYQYWVLMDVFGNPPFVTEADLPGSTLPKQIGRASLFNYVESELKAIETNLVAAQANEYGRADRAACQALLARLYLNAQVYTGTPKFTEAITYAKKVIDAGYTPIANYTQLMLADNNTNTSENIFTINYDGKKTQNYGGTTFVKNASIGGSMNSATYGTSQAWGGTRTTKNLINLFPDVTGTQDKRAQFYTSGQNLEIADLTKFTDGYAVTKFRNKTKSGADGSDQVFSDIDMPLFRITEMYLIYAEAILRGGTGGDNTLALGYINAIRTRAYGNTSGNINSSGLTLDFILDERARELYWEGFRRTDLIRYNRFVEGTYLWPWKGGAKDGTGVASFRKVFPIPASDISANVNLVQNSGY